jgi:hypothetical protein
MPHQPTYKMETHRKLYHKESGSYTSIGPDRDGLGLVEIIQYDGSAITGCMTFTPGEIPFLVDALSNCAAEVGKMEI